MQAFWCLRGPATLTLTWIALLVATSARPLKETDFAEGSLGLRDGSYGEAEESAAGNVGLRSLLDSQLRFGFKPLSGFWIPRFSQEQGASRALARRLLVPGTGDASSNGGNASNQQQPANMPTGGYYFSTDNMLGDSLLSIVLAIGFCVALFVIMITRRLCVTRGRRRRGARNAQPQTQDAPSSGLPFSVLKALPIVSFKKEAETETLNQGSGDNQCPICLIEFEEKDKLRKLPECSHYFHQSCVDEWLKRNHTCPLCRTSLLPPGEVAPSPINDNPEEVLPTPTNTVAALEQEPGQAVPPLAPMEREGPRVTY